MAVIECVPTCATVGEKLKIAWPLLFRASPLELPMVVVRPLNVSRKKTTPVGMKPAAVAPLTASAMLAVIVSGVPTVAGLALAFTVLVIGALIVFSPTARDVPDLKLLSPPNCALITCVVPAAKLRVLNEK